jgi:hypothetical protein
MFKPSLYFLSWLLGWVFIIIKPNLLWIFVAAILAYTLVGVIIGVIGVVVSRAWIVANELLEAAIGFTARRFKKCNLVQAAMNATGVGFFLVGSALQLFATSS